MLKKKKQQSKNKGAQSLDSQKCKDWWKRKQKPKT
jgi:hypothetical protein